MNTLDPDMWSAFEKERQRQQDHIELIASENFTSLQVMQAMIWKRYKVL